MDMFAIVLAAALIIYISYRLVLGSVHRAVKQADDLKLNRMLVRTLFSQLNTDLRQSYARQLDPKKLGPDLNFLAHLVFYSRLFFGSPSELGWLKRHFESPNINIRKDEETVQIMINSFNMGPRLSRQEVLSAMQNIEDSEQFRSSYEGYEA